jgi:hypothetical protein
MIRRIVSPPAACTMDATRFSVMNYHHDGPRERGRVSRTLSTVLLLAAVAIAALNFPHPAMAAALFPLAFWLVLVLTAGQQRLYLGSRYLLCGARIVYFGTVRQIELDAAAGWMKLVRGDGQSFVLERERFPTGARKTDKIALNKAAKFDKAATRILARVLRVVPGVTLHGVSDDLLAAARGAVPAG